MITFLLQTELFGIEKPSFLAPETQISYIRKQPAIRLFSYSIGISNILSTDFIADEGRIIK